MNMQFAYKTTPHKAISVTTMAKMSPKYAMHCITSTTITNYSSNKKHIMGK